MRIIVLGLMIIACGRLFFSILTLTIPKLDKANNFRCVNGSFEAGEMFQFIKPGELTFGILTLGCSPEVNQLIAGDFTLVEAIQMMVAK